MITITDLGTLKHCLNCLKIPYTLVPESDKGKKIRTTLCVDGTLDKRCTSAWCSLDFNFDRHGGLVSYDILGGAGSDY